LHVFLAGQDRIIDNRKTKAFVRRLHWSGSRMTEYDDAHHTLEFEPAPESFLADLVAWLSSQSALNGTSPGATAPR
jgi:alpha-beta hydrolase superfamily lysophospholipase